jgi:hypothetical protein
MFSNRKVITSAALAMTLVALVLTLALQPPIGPPSPNTSLYECSLFLIYGELLVLLGYYSCILYCERSLDDLDEKALCINNCLRWYIVAQIGLVVAYITCILAVIFF